MDYLCFVSLSAEVSVVRCEGLPQSLAESWAQGQVLEHGGK